MALVLNEDQTLLRDSARAFLQEHSPLGMLRTIRDTGQGWSPGLWSAMSGMGWPGVAIPEDVGGLGFGYVGAGLLLEECGRTLAHSPLLSSALVCASLIGSLGSEQQKRSLLPNIASGESILALALDETARTDPAAVAMSATRDGGSHILSGRKARVVDGTIAGKLLVVARTSGVAGDESGLSLFLVDVTTVGVTVSPALELDSHQVADILFEGVRVPDDALLGEADAVWPALQRALDIGAVCSAAEMLGIAQQAFETTMAYLKERKQFGVPIGSFQSLQHRAAELFCDIELCRSAVLKALQALDEDNPSRALLASLAKAKAGKTVQRAVNEAVQMHGGMGMTDEFDIGFFMKRAAVTRQQFGDYYYHADRFARLRSY